MKLFPYESYYLGTQLNLDDVRKRIQNEVESKKLIMYRWFSKDIERSYEGVVLEDEFRINRIIKYYNSFQPSIKGNFFTISGQTVIHITLKMDVMVTAITILIGVLLITSMIFMAFMFLNGHFNRVLLSLSTFLLMMYLFSLLLFKLESRGSKKFLIELFKAQKIKQ